MNKRFIPLIIFLIYSAVLIKVMVFKDIPTIRVGHLILKFGGAEAAGEDNLIPLKTIVWYFRGSQGVIIGGINLVGNIILLIPIGFIAPFLFRNVQWRQVLILGIVAGLTIEIMQKLFHVGIFDIDDVILNTLGVLIGYWIILKIKKSRISA